LEVKKKTVNPNVTNTWLQSAVRVLKSISSSMSLTTVLHEMKIQHRHLQHTVHGLFLFTTNPRFSLKIRFMLYVFKFK